MLRTLAAITLVIFLISPCGNASAQIAPTAVELSAYRGLHAAASHGSAEAIRHLAREGAELNGRDSNGRTPLHVAVFQGHAAAAKALIEAGADAHVLDRQHYDAVTIAVVRDDIPTLKALLTSGASAKLVTSVYNGTVLIAAAHLGHDGIVRELALAGAPLDHVNNLGWTALIEAVILGDGGPRYIETVRLLVEAGADRGITDRNGVMPLQHAQARGYAGMAAILQSAAANR